MPWLLRGWWQDRAAQRILANFISGMTDRETCGLHKELFEV